MGKDNIPAKITVPLHGPGEFGHAVGNRGQGAASKRLDHFDF